MNMLYIKLCVAIVAFLLLNDNVQGKKSKKSKRPKLEEEANSPQPNVVSYSTFGFNDVGTYEGFVPSSPDYAKFLSGTNQETSSRIHSSGFPTSPDSNNFGQGFSSQAYSGQSFNANEDGESQSSLTQFPQSSMNFFNTPSFDSNVDQHRNNANDEIYSRDAEHVSEPIYGTKITSKNKMRPFNYYNHTDYGEPTGIQNEEKFLNYNEGKPTFEKRPSHSESSNSFYSSPSYSSPSGVDYKQVPSDSQTPLKFQRVVDFTKFNQYYPTDLDTSKLSTGTPIPDVYENRESNQNAPGKTTTYNIDSKENKHYFSPVKQKHTYEQNNQGETTEKNYFKLNNIKEDSYNYSGFSSGKDNLLITNDSENNKKSKTKPWPSGGQYIKKWKEPSPTKGYGYSTNYSTMSFKYEADENKISKPFGSSIDEIVPASSNIETPSYQFLEIDPTNFKKMPEYKVHEEDDFADFTSYKDTFKPQQSAINYNQYKYLFSTAPTTTSYWGNVYKSSDYTSLKNHPFSNKHKAYKDNDEVVNIPRKPNKLSYESPFESKPSDWTQFGRRPYKNIPFKDWSNEVPNTRFKSEEDLLGLRNQDTSHPSHLPSYRPNHFDSDEVEYKKIVDKWRQSYLQSKYKDSLVDYENYGSETKPTHVSIPKPYPIEVPHPVIVPVPQPYPVRVPIAKPVAVPVIRELRVPIEKPMPYPVYKHVPYPIEKPVPVPVEKEVQVPIEKPYPVHIPYIRPVFHHTKPRDEYDSDHRDNDDYFPRPESSNKYNNMRYKKKQLNSSRNRPRRPSRTAYQDRNRRRWPDRRRPAMIKDEDLRPHMRERPTDYRYPSPFKRHDSEPTRFAESSSNLRFNCNISGKC